MKSEPVWCTLYSNMRMKYTEQCYVCRHTFATELYRRGVSLKSAQYLLGHSTPDITARIYVDSDEGTANDEMLAKLVSDISEDLGLTVEELLD